ncbi:endopeptidase La [Candidatus Kinetoplastidibacterium crithidiae]|uniref:Lon protease n=1 Tax=Candidatus Kinetoplastidibacterium crithidiae TCC036E TaxID=1208918 RepID=M1LWC0_9PROT|nr:endopeptidase La [Candidatus Kinetoplastibacterium crithidii]AFZ82813.1 ATP-dependent protease La [Candidatus Kinetoplastibacterium crithidii (ex Angomonas deanei ATCC 30255)]AGF47534.1 ATP-dependent Lon protease [Candidatus Kinetoplastibacterium crithidii TCC036E]
MSASQTVLSESVSLPLLPLRDVVIFPYMTVPLFVGRSRSIRALEIAMEGDKNVVLVTQKSAGKDEPDASDLYHVGCVANILQMLKLPDGTVKVLVEGVGRVDINSVEDLESHFMCHITDIKNEQHDASDIEIEALKRTLIEQFDQYLKLNKKIPTEVLTSLSDINDIYRFVDTISSHLPIKLEYKQNILEMGSVVERIEFLLSQIDSEIEILQVEKKIKTRIKKQMEKSQRDYYLNEQFKAIQKELGESDDNLGLDELENRISSTYMTKEARKKLEAEFLKLKMMSPMSAEANVIRNYIDTVLSLPWKKKTKINLDIGMAENVLDADHYGLDKVKERILEYLAVQKRVQKLKAPILCLVGPPGVGKTSLGQSIAMATNRKFVRMALGGVRDEAEIRGHRRTYIGSMPGKILQNISKSGVRNPLFLLDEIDKIGMDFRGDPASALLEVLDPEQNNSFQDHYIEIDFDLSDVMFVATSNTMNIPPALLDRMEIINLSGYTEHEKLHIAKQHLVPKLFKNNGLLKNELEISENAILDIIRYYTREAGVRSLEREISKICRKVVKNSLKNSEGGKSSVLLSTTVDSDNIGDYLGVRRYDFGSAEKDNRIGQVTALAWTEVGGDLLTVEVADIPGKGNILRTGSLGDVMKESIEAARTVVRSKSEYFNFSEDMFNKRDMHIHVPEGATPKDGPSAGIAITTAMVSALSKIAVRSDVAMTGEITLRGEVLPIGGLKEKILAAHRGGIKTIIIPETNVRDLTDIPDFVKQDIEIVPVKWIDKVFDVALEHPVNLSNKKIRTNKKGSITKKNQNNIDNSLLNH